MWDRKELKQRGKAAFKANYWKCVLAALLLTLFTVGSGVATRSASSNVNYNVNNPSGGTDTTVTMDVENMSLTDALNAAAAEGAITPEQAQQIGSAVEALTSDPEAMAAMRTALMALGGIVIIGGIVGFLLKQLVFGPLEIGCRNFFTRNSEDPAELSTLERGFKPSYGRNVGGMFLRDLFIFLWSLLLVIPGIVKTYSYRMVPYILADNPDITGMEAITLSRQMMNGHKWQTFVLDLSFLGWYILSAFTLGILGIFYVNPYKAGTDAELYQALKN